MPVDKRAADAAAALAGIEDGATVMISGFGGSGMPNALVAALLELGVRDLVLISNSAGHNGSQVARLVEAGRVRRVVSSSARGRGNPPAPFEVLWTQGKIELELVPQGSFAERIRAGGAGIPAFYTPAGLGTELTQGKEVRRFGERDYVLETALTADVALLRAELGDRYGNLRFRGTQANFGPAMAAAARLTVVEVAEIVRPVIAPDQVHVPGIYVDRVVALPDMRP